ncbi:metallophosphoesterase family protein [Hansschlegelia zhihuaiae]|uniref:Serine/threonine protein phosphatase n=1 Tax=Hansschlegelia zhihuaiae TaxID=405005 RepID=A0A4Q0MHS4_9HYPH|nr:metallophosphoesterase family protein [Hansschlegelia zhihuaiae]RXF73151.1 serine/threonine protein phosphatase [Hansschlegelia zhihuaiae]
MTSIVIRRGDWLPAIRPLGAGEAVAAVGDVHGHDDLFAALMDSVAEDLSGAEQATFIQVGDLVDRGPASLGALRRARAGLPGAQSFALMGNHEDRMLRALAGDPAEQDSWLGFGGAETLASARVDPRDPAWPERLREALGDELTAWLAALPVSRRVGDLLFVHAGIDPDAPLDRQQPRTMIWTRWPWLDSSGPYPEGVAVIHGHTPQPRVNLAHPHRINLDTGAFRTGLLSALVVAGDRMRLVQASR